MPRKTTAESKLYKIEVWQVLGCLSVCLRSAVLGWLCVCVTLHSELSGRCKDKPLPCRFFIGSERCWLHCVTQPCIWGGSSLFTAALSSRVPSPAHTHSADRRPHDERRQPVLALWPAHTDFSSSKRPVRITKCPNWKRSKNGSLAQPRLPKMACEVLLHRWCREREERARKSLWAYCVS